MLRTGTAVGGLVIDSLLGRGGMGEVYRAMQTSLGRSVAVKRISSALMHDEGVIERFRREATMIARLNHPNVLSVYDFNTYQDDDGDAHVFLVMELVEAGCSAKDLLRQSLTWQQASAITLMAAQGLAVVQAHSIVHRDIKPDNIMVTANGVAKLCDFGLAKAADSQQLTMSGSLLGTPAYLPPEVCEGESGDHRGDIYSLCATWLHLLSGKPPYEAKSTIELIRAHADRPVPKVRDRCPSCPRALAKLLERGLSKQPHNRPSGAEMVEELQRRLPDMQAVCAEIAQRVYSHQRAAGETPVAPTVPTVQPNADTVPSNLTPTIPSGPPSVPAYVQSFVRRGRGRKINVFIGALGGVIVVGLVFLVLMMTNRTAPSQVEAESASQAPVTNAKHSDSQQRSEDHQSLGPDHAPSVQPLPTPQLEVSGMPQEQRDLAMDLAQVDLRRGRPLAAWSRIADYYHSNQSMDAGQKDTRLHEMVEQIRALAQSQRLMLYLEINKNIEMQDFATAQYLLERHGLAYAELYEELEEYERVKERLRELAGEE